MRVLILSFILLGLPAMSFGQHTEDSLGVTKLNHEIKANVLNITALQAIDISYEFLINENASCGLDIFFKFYRNEIQEASWFSFEAGNNRGFSLTPYFRRYFSKGYASGFFVEGFGMLNSGKTVNTEYIYNESQDPLGFPETIELKSFDTYTDFAIGLSLGGKITLKKGFLMEFYTGLGLNTSYAFSAVVTRGGFSLGFRF